MDDKIRIHAKHCQMFELYNMSGDPDDFSQMMNLDNTKAHVLIRLSNPENRIIKDVKSQIERLIESIPAEITIGGYAIIMTDFAASIIKGQASSLIFALVTVFILLSIIFKSAQGGFIGSVPLAVSIPHVWIHGICRDCQCCTALLSSIMIGVGVDFTISISGASIARSEKDCHMRNPLNLLSQ